MRSRIGRPPISTSGFGHTSVASARRVPRPPAGLPTFTGLYPRAVCSSLLVVLTCSLSQLGEATSSGNTQQGGAKGAGMREKGTLTCPHCHHSTQQVQNGRTPSGSQRSLCRVWGQSEERLVDAQGLFRGV